LQSHGRAQDFVATLICGKHLLRIGSDGHEGARIESVAKLMHMANFIRRIHQEVISRILVVYKLHNFAELVQ